MFARITELLANTGDRYSYTVMACAYAHGVGVPASKEETMKWLRADKDTWRLTIRQIEGGEKSADVLPMPDPINSWDLEDNDIEIPAFPMFIE